MSVDLNPEILSHLFPHHAVSDNVREKIMHVLQHDPEFPSFPPALARLQERVNNPDTGLEEISELVRVDPSLTGRIFSLARSASFGGVPISSIEDALFRLGLRETRSAILATKLITRFTHLKIKLDWNKFWVHSLLASRLAQAIADVYQTNSSKAYTAGLLSSSGILLLAHYFPQEFDIIISTLRKTNDNNICDVERQIIGTDHAALGAALALRWGVDEEIIHAIQYQNNVQDSTKYRFLPVCIYLAHLGADMVEDNVYRDKIGLVAMELNDIEQWQLLADFKPRKAPHILIDIECAKARDTVAALALPSR